MTSSDLRSEILYVTGFQLLRISVALSLLFVEQLTHIGEKLNRINSCCFQISREPNATGLSSQLLLLSVTLIDITNDSQRAFSLHPPKKQSLKNKQYM